MKTQKSKRLDLAREMHTMGTVQVEDLGEKKVAATNDCGTGPQLMSEPEHSLQHSAGLSPR